MIKDDITIVVSLLSIATSILSISSVVSKFRAALAHKQKQIDDNTTDVRALASFVHMYLLYRSGKNSTLNERSIDRFLSEHFHLDDD